MFNSHRSFRATIIEKILKASNLCRLSTEEKAKIYMEKRARVEDAPLKFKINKYGENAKITNYHEMQVITLGDEKLSEHTVLYIHGGGYVDEILPEHLRFCNKLSKKLNAFIVIPIYPLLPNHNYKETYKLITMLYRDLLCKKNNDITIMGDSAGGGFALAFCQHLKFLGLEEPKNLIVFSPWVDISMSGNKYNQYVKKDPLLSVEGAKSVGKVWAGDLDVKNPLVSPTFGDNSRLPPTLIFVGTNEIFYPDIIDYYKKMKKSGVKVELIIGEKMDHVYPIYPIPEAHKAMDQIIQKIKN